MKRRAVVFFFCLVALRAGALFAQKPSAANLPEPVLQVGPGFVTSIALSPDGRLLLIGSDADTTAIWEVATGRRLRILAGHTEAISSVAFSPDGKLALTGSGDKSAAVWDVVTGRRLRTLEGHTNEVASVVFSPDGKFALTGAYDATTVIWDVATGRQLRVLKGHRDTVTSIAFGPDGKFVITGSNDKTAAVWDVATGRRIRTLEGHTHNVNSVAFSPDGKLALTGSSDHTAAVWDVEAGRRLRALKGHTSSVNSVAFSPDGKLGLTGSWDETVGVWDVVTGRRLRILEGHTEEISSVAFSPDGSIVFTGSWDNTVGVWDIVTSRRLRTLEGHTSNVALVGFSRDGKLVLTGSEDQTVTLWDVATGRRLRILEGLTESISSVAFSHEGQLAFIGSWDNSAAVWDLISGRKLRTFEPPEGHVVNSAAFSPDGRLVLTSSIDGKSIVWDAATCRRLHTLDGHTNWVWAVAVSPDGKVALTGSEDNTAAVWDIATGQLLHTLRGHAEGVTSVAFSPDGKLALTGSKDKTAAVWDISTGRRMYTLEGHTEWVDPVAISPDGEMVLTISEDDTATVWDVATGRQLRNLDGFIHNARGVTFSPSGKLAVMPSAEGLAAYDIATGALLYRQTFTNAGILTTTPEGLFDGPSEASEAICYRVGGGLNVVPVDRFYQDFSYAGLYDAVHRGERPKPDVELGAAAPPTLQILERPDEDEVADQRVTIGVVVTDQGGGVSGPWLRHNGARIATSGAKRVDGNRLTQSFDVSLVAGINRLSIEAASGDGSWEAEPALIELRYTKSLDKPDLYLIAVGAAVYAEPSLRLQLPDDDASAMASLFESRGRTLYESVEVTSLLNDQATKQAILNGIDAVAKQAKPQDTLAVYLAGHGFAVGQRYYFLPCNMKLESQEFEDDVRRQGLPSDRLADAIGATPCLKRMLIYDTCNSGAAIRRSGKRDRNPLAFAGAVRRLSRGQGVFTITAAAADEEAAEIASLGHGALTYALLAGMRAVEGGPLEGRYVQTNNQDRVADVLEWFSFASGNLHRVVGAGQTAVVDNSGTPFPVLPVGE
ncbi:caspase family protein [Lacipirellula limnantheis]|uniref:Translocation protein TolB n=1 Tax=Lacipirellula limnantheis TaxID=2528024 RepID=A0A517TTP7_9BACT|nr:caspase family protein [Lacipirellula limnantheis]QDT71733.1 translocation protein TolB [Lacipirellula limnantheis]